MDLINLKLSNGRAWWCGIPDDVTNGIDMKFVDFGREDYQDILCEVFKRFWCRVKKFKTTI